VNTKMRRGLMPPSPDDSESGYVTDGAMKDHPASKACVYRGDLM